MSSTWRVRYEGTAAVAEVASAQAVVEGLRDGEWEPGDEVRGPGDAGWSPIEDHPVFREAVAEMAPPAGDHPDETKLDMNPLIDVALVLLIFFILTTTYASLRRAIDLPDEPDPNAVSQTPLKREDVTDRTFVVSLWTEPDGRHVTKVADKVVPTEDLERELKEVVRTTGRREILLEVEGSVPWGVTAKVHDAAKAADCQRIYSYHKQGK